MKELLLGLAFAMCQAAACAQASAANQLESGEVRRVDKERNKVSLRHGELKSVGMPPMTMVFAVSNPQQLDPLKVGDKVLFKVIKKPDGSLLVTHIKLSQ